MSLASGASAGSSASTATSGGEGKSAATSGGAPDVSKVLESHQGAIKSTQDHLGKFSKEFEGLKSQQSKDSELLGKIRDVFSPEKQKGPDPVADMEKQLDYYLAQAVEAEKRGQPIPLTTNLAVQFFQSQIQAHQEKAELMNELKALKGKLGQVSDPSATINNTAYSNIDASLINGLDQLYGQGEERTSQKAAQFDAISRQIAEHIQLMQKKAPAEWDKVRRSPAIQQKLVNHFLKQNLPPQAVKLIEQQKLMSTPMTQTELWQAFREAEQIENIDQRRKIRSEIRQQILEGMYSGQN